MKTKKIIFSILIAFIILTLGSVVFADNNSYLDNPDNYNPINDLDCFWLQDVSFEKLTEEQKENYKICLKKATENSDIKSNDEALYNSLMAIYNEHYSTEGTGGTNGSPATGNKPAAGTIGEKYSNPNVNTINLLLDNPDLISTYQNWSDVVPLLGATPEIINTKAKKDSYINCLLKVANNGSFRAQMNSQGYYDDFLQKIDEIKDDESWNFTDVQKQFLESAKNNMNQSAKDNKQNQDIAEGNVQADTSSNIIYHNPQLSDATGSAEKSIDDMITDGDKFIKNVESVDSPISQAKIKNFSNTFYNILLALGVVVAVVMGMIMGIKFMMGSVEEKADIKTMLVPYIIGCIVVFAGFGIWKAVVVILESI